MRNDFLSGNARNAVAVAAIAANTQAERKTKVGGNPRKF
jgi:hypothetical protein